MKLFLPWLSVKSMRLNFNWPIKRNSFFQYSEMCELCFIWNLLKITLQKYEKLFIEFTIQKSNQHKKKPLPTIQMETSEGFFMIPNEKKKKQ